MEMRVVRLSTTDWRHIERLLAHDPGQFPGVVKPERSRRLAHEIHTQLGWPAPTDTEEE